VCRRPLSRTQGNRLQNSAANWGSFRGPKGTALLTLRPLLIRDSESFVVRYRGAEGTLRVPIGARLVSLETESRG
jgi:hypothetical protein